MNQPTTSGGAAWIADPDLHALLMRLPLPLVILGADGGEQFRNERFATQFVAGAAAADGLARVAAAPGQPWQKVRLKRRDGSMLDARAQAITVKGGVMVLVDETPDHAESHELVQLRARVAELERTSSTDYLTGMWNRSHLDRMIQIEIRRSVRFRQPVSLILLDIDHFKLVNDTHGHQVGDGVLRTLSEIVHGGIRAADMLFRWGGEEFVVLTASTGHRRARVLAESLRVRVEAHDFGAVGRVTISLGVAEYAEGETAKEWFHRLDDALYAAKNGGRNRVFENLRGNSNQWAAESGSSPLRLVWQEAYDCGEPDIDREHHELFELSNRVIDASLQREQFPEHFERALDALLAHIEGHFAHEERILAQHGYDRLDQHRKAHASLIAHAAELRRQVLAGNATLGDLTEFLADSVVARHLFTADRDFYPLFAPPPA